MENGKGEERNSSTEGIHQRGPGEFLLPDVVQREGGQWYIHLFFSIMVDTVCFIQNSEFDIKSTRDGF